MKPTKNKQYHIKISSDFVITDFTPISRTLALADLACARSIFYAEKKNRREPKRAKFKKSLFFYFILFDLIIFDLIIFYLSIFFFFLQN